MNIFDAMSPRRTPYRSSPLLPIILLVIILLFTLHSHAQQEKPEKKLSPRLIQALRSGVLKGKIPLQITVRGRDLPTAWRDPIYRPEKVSNSRNFTFYYLQAVPVESLQDLLQSDEVVFIERGDRIAKKELIVGSLDLSLNQINLVHRFFPKWNGAGSTVSVKEDKPDTMDIDFKGRYLPTELASATTSGHASVMSTMIAGAGNSWYLSKGAAWGARISSSSFATLLPDPDEAYRQYDISVQNHSYGVEPESYYGADAAAYDATAIDNPVLLHVFSSGNAGNEAASTGLYKGLRGFANLTGSFKMGKNILTVSALDSFGRVEYLSSGGPAHDGRVKPELAAFGEDGSSGAAALVTGSALVLQQAYLDRYGVKPENALLRAILLNSADKPADTALSYRFGYGKLNAYQAVNTIEAGHILNGSVSEGEVQSFSIQIPSGIGSFKITLAWNDPPAEPNAGRALVNDLDLEVTRQASGSKWLPWVLNSFPHPDSLRQPPARKRDSLNTVEQVTIPHPDAGEYTIRVKGQKTGTAQAFYLAYQMDQGESFTWTFPTKSDVVLPGKAQVIRWQTNSDHASGSLSFSTDYGNNWTLADSAADLQKGYYNWQTPAFSGAVLLRMAVGSQVITSDTFMLSEGVITDVGFACPDSFLIYWKKVPGADSYLVYRLGEFYLEPVTTTPDTFYIGRQTPDARYHAVVPLFGNREGMKSYTFDYSNQGVACYIRSFLAYPETQAARIELTLGSLYGVERVILEKEGRNGYVPVQEVQDPVSLSLAYTDQPLAKGVNRYRSRLELANGNIIYSGSAEVYNLEGAGIIVYPNPLPNGQAVQILIDEELDLPLTLLVYDLAGRKLLQRNLEDYTSAIPLTGLPAGIYVFRFLPAGHPPVMMKVVVR